MQVLKPPTPLSTTRNSIKIFLAGSIEQGKAEDWQTKIQNELKGHSNITIYNPRRDNWDSSWKQSIDNKNFYEQVTWELEALDSSDIIILYLQLGTQSPISLT
eukprot:UN17804